MITSRPVPSISGTSPRPCRRYPAKPARIVVGISKMAKIGCSQSWRALADVHIGNRETTTGSARQWKTQMPERLTPILSHKSRRTFSPSDAAAAGLAIPAPLTPEPATASGCKSACFNAYLLLSCVLSVYVLTHADSDPYRDRFRHLFRQIRYWAK